MGMQLLGGLSTKKFLSGFWQKRPLLIRGAMPGFEGVVQTPELFRLAARDDVESRLVQRRAGKWRLEHGPFSPADFARLPASAWTLLVQGLNLVHPSADALLRRFSFIPYARLDDVMLSYAAPRGGVGPHVDSYDVFLLQGSGRRRWRWSAPAAHAFDARAPLKILTNFEAEEEAVLEPGDMLYLPPGYAHEGTAVDACTTYSIGFRALAHQEMAAEFLAFLQEGVDLDGLYADPDLRMPSNPAEIPGAMLSAVERAVEAIRWGKPEMARFLGQYLTAPKAHVEFEPPRRPLPATDFGREARRRGVRLDLRSQMLFRGAEFFINGASSRPPSGLRPWLTRLAHERQLAPAARLPQALFGLLHDWYLSGWIRIGIAGEEA